MLLIRPDHNSVLLAIALLAAAFRTGAPGQLLRADKSEALGELSSRLEFLARNNAPERELFEQIYRVRISFFVERRLDGTLSGDRLYLNTLSAILDRWASVTGAGSTRETSRRFMGALRTATDFYCLWKVLPHPDKGSVSRRMLGEGVDLSDGLNDNELERFSLRHAEIESLYQGMLSKAIAAFQSTVRERLRESSAFWDVFLRHARVTDRTVLYLRRIPLYTVRCNDGSLVVGEPANDPPGSIYLPPNYAYRPLQFGRALVHQIGALWGLKHPVNSEIERVFEEWFSNGRDQGVSITPALQSLVLAQIGTESTDRH